VRVAVVGGTGDLGFGLAVRLGAAGVDVTIGSRVRDRAEQAAERAREAAGGSVPVDGAENPDAVAGADVVVVTVPFEGQAATYRSLKESWPEGVTVCDTTTPLATAVGGRPTHVLRPWHGSAAEQARALLPDGVPLVAGFHSVGAETLEAHPDPVDADALLCGDDDGAKARIGELIDLIPGMRWIDCGPLSMARVLEPVTAVLISVNRRYAIKDAGVRLSGREDWGRPT
jgi:NADPH-dependent F420 reductase